MNTAPTMAKMVVATCARLIRHRSAPPTAAAATRAPRHRLGGALADVDGGDPWRLLPHQLLQVFEHHNIWEPLRKTNSRSVIRPPVDYAGIDGAASRGTG